jgi:large subunit ribosomal protein L6
MSTDTDRSREVIEVPAAVTFTVGTGTIRAKGPLGTVERPFPSDVLKVATSKGSLTLTLAIPPERKQAQALLKTWAAHVRNLAGGLTLGVEAKMKVVAAHFPMKVSVRGEELVIENFLGEKFPRTTKLRPGTKASVEGDIVVLAGHDVEQVGQSAANIERVTHIRDYDPRVFQDGIYLIERAHLKEAA